MEHAKEVIMQKASGRHLEASGEHLGAIWKHLETAGEVIWEASGDVWKHLGIIAEPSWRHLGSIHLRFSPPAQNMNKKRYKGSGFPNYGYSAQICYVSFDISWDFAMEANRMVNDS